MISNILIAVDGSKHSMKGIDVGSQIAAGVNAKLVLLHVIKEEKIPEAMREFAKAEHLELMDIDIRKRGAQHMLAKAVDKVRANGVNDVDIEVEEGPIARMIVRRAEQNGADLIVVGSRGMGDIEGLLRGGVSHRVETLAKCPVLVVK